MRPAPHMERPMSPLASPACCPALPDLPPQCQHIIPSAPCILACPPERDLCSAFVSGRVLQNNIMCALSLPGVVCQTGKNNRAWTHAALQPSAARPPAGCTASHTHTPRPRPALPRAECEQTSKGSGCETKGVCGASLLQPLPRNTALCCRTACTPAPFPRLSLPSLPTGPNPWPSLPTPFALQARLRRPQTCRTC